MKRTLRWTFVLALALLLAVGCMLTPVTAKAAGETYRIYRWDAASGKLAYDEEEVWSGLRRSSVLMV